MHSEAGEARGQHLQIQEPPHSQVLESLETVMLKFNVCNTCIGGEDVQNVVGLLSIYIGLAKGILNENTAILNVISHSTAQCRSRPSSAVQWYQRGMLISVLF